MPPQIQALLEDKRMLAIIGVVLVVVVGISIFAMGQSGNSGDPGDRKLDAKQLTLATVNNPGRALEIQALLAQQGIQMDQEMEGEKVTLKFGKEARLKDRDKALITLVQSGLMDKNVGLEAFDKGDLTASREEKRIKLIRAQQGELARLIRKIKPIQDANVSIAIPEQTIFRSEEKPISASVQVTLDPSAYPDDPAPRLTKDKVRAIINLMVGSVQGLDAKHVSLSDTNGNTYNSVLDGSDEMADRLSERDAYMKEKVAAQLNRLVGAGNYVVTVSTQMREAPKEMMVQQYDPQGTVVSSKQTFHENLNSGGALGAAGAATSFLPGGLGNIHGGGGSSSKDYLRNGVEATYSNSKTQWIETHPVGMVEDISVAVTIDADHFPGMSVGELQQLLANAASPAVRPERVTIAKSNLQRPGPLADLNTANDTPLDLTWLMWAGGCLAVLMFLLILANLKPSGGGRGRDEDLIQAQKELQHLRDLATQQQAQLQATQQQTQMLLEAQQQRQSQPSLTTNTTTDPERQLASNNALQQTLEELKSVVASDEHEDDLDMQIKSWIESS